MPNESEAAPIRLVAGLGNPGPEYERTRHNIGFMVLDQLAADSGVQWDRNAKWGAYWAKTNQALLVKPMTYMNRSGGPLSAVAQFYKIEPNEMFVVFDDMDLPLGRLRIRLGGGTGGHNGLDSIITTFGEDQIPRLRIGIGAAPDRGAVDYVLGRFFEEELPIVEKSVARAVEAIKCAIDKGVLSAMNTFNKIPES
ncbi:MAG: aminoacyl-tRNA hydrolase [Chthoniobacterales bacterium]